MNKRPIEQASDADIRQSKAALLRAALRARAIARTTGTALVVSRNGVVELLVPASDEAQAVAHEPAAPYRGER